MPQSEGDGGLTGILLSALISELKGTLRDINTKIVEVESNIFSKDAQVKAFQLEADGLRGQRVRQAGELDALQAEEQALQRFLGEVADPYDDARETAEVLTRIDLLDKETQIFRHQTDQILLLLDRVFSRAEPDAFSRLLETYNLQLVLDKCREIYSGSVEKMAIHSDLPRLARNFEVVDIDGRPALELEAEDSNAACCLKVLCALARVLHPAGSETEQRIRERWAPEETEDKADYILRFIHQVLGVESRVVRILRACNQAVLAPFVTRIKLGLGEALAHNSTRNSWKIHIRVHPDCVLVTHTKREQSAPATESAFGHFEFEWSVEYTLDSELITFADVSFNLGKYLKLDNAAPPSHVAHQFREVFNDLIIGTLVWSPEVDHNLRNIKRGLGAGALRLRRGSSRHRPVSTIGAMSPLKSTPTPSLLSPSGTFHRKDADDPEHAEHAETPESPTSADAQFAQPEEEEQEEQGEISLVIPSSPPPRILVPPPLLSESFRQRLEDQKS